MSSSSVGWKWNPAGRFRFGATTLLLLLRLGLGMAMETINNARSPSDLLLTATGELRGRESVRGRETLKQGDERLALRRERGRSLEIFEMQGLGLRFIDGLRAR